MIITGYNVNTILEIQNLNVSFTLSTNKSKERNFSVLKNFSLSLFKEEILTIVGPSGSGKSVFISALLDILPQNALVNAEIFYKKNKIDHLRNKAIYIPQSSSYLDPLMKVGRQITLRKNELSERTKNLYPFQCSGGMLRNALFDLIYDNDAAEIVMADEPTPGMDTPTAINNLSILQEATKRGKSVLLVTHDIDLAMEISDRIAVFYDGAIVEIARAEDFKSGRLHHHYTKALFNALPQNGFTPFEFKKERDENVCFCMNFCHKYNENCHGNIPLTPIDSGYVRCANAPLW